MEFPLLNFLLFAAGCGLLYIGTLIVPIVTKTKRDAFRLLSLCVVIAVWLMFVASHRGFEPAKWWLFTAPASWFFGIACVLTSLIFIHITHSDTDDRQ